MGKKSSFKNLRKLADELPQITVYRRVGEVVNGFEVIERGMELPKGGRVMDSFKLKQSVPMPLNHYRQLKSAFARSGVQGVEIYVKAVNAYQAQQQRKAVEAEQTQSAPTFDEGDE